MVVDQVDNRELAYKQPMQLSTRQKILKYYEEAGPDYQTWSPSYNMHFGYFHWGMNPFSREKMLDRMNLEIFRSMDISKDQSALIGDMGCGLGATARYIAKHFPAMSLKGITLVPWQVDQGTRLARESGLDGRVKIVEGDYTSTPFEDNSLDGVYAVESGCYAGGASKEDLIREMARVLKPGKKMVMADGFVKTEKMTGWTASIYQKLCSCWALKELGHIDKVREALLRHGFTDIRIRDASWRVAPSVAHVPFTVLWFLVKRMFSSNGIMTKERWNNLMAPMLTMFLGLSRRNFSYYIISARKM